MSDNDFIMVRKMTDFLKRFGRNNYEVFASDDELLIKFYLEKGEPEVWISTEYYAVVFDDYSGFEQLTLDELIEKFEAWEKA